MNTTDGNQENPKSKTGREASRVHLVPLTEEIRAKGRSTITPRKRLANSLNAMKHGRYSQFNKLVIELAKDPEFHALHMLDLVIKWESKAQKFQEGMQIIDKHALTYKAIHGEKTKNININVDLRADLEEWYKTV